MVFGNEKAATAIDAWAIDDNVVGKIGALLGKRFSVKKINHPKEHVQGKSKRRPNSGTAFAASLPRQKCDLYIVVSRAAGISALPAKWSKA